MPPCSDLCQSVFSRGQDHKWETSPPSQTSSASGQVNLTISQSPTLTKLSVCQIFRDRIMKTHNLIWSIHWHTPKNGIEHQVKSTWQLISPRLTKLSVCQIFTDRIMKTHNIGRSIHWHIPKDGIEPAWEVWQLSEGDSSLPLEWQFSRNWSGGDRWLRVGTRWDDCGGALRGNNFLSIFLELAWELEYWGTLRRSILQGEGKWSSLCSDKEALVWDWSHQRGWVK